MNYEYERDSLKLRPDRREEYSYDGLFRLNVQLEYNWNSYMQDWEISYKVENIYDAEGLLISEIGSRWMVFENEWNLSQKFEYEYDPEERLISRKIYIQPDTGTVWLKYERTDYTYDTYGNLSGTTDWVVEEWWDEWVPDHRKWVVFNENGSTVRRSYSHWEQQAGAWTSRTETFEYSPGGYLEKTCYFRDETATGESWKYMTEMLYNDARMFSGWKEYDWDGVEGDWVEDYRGECTYGEQGKIISVKDLYLDNDLHKWVDDHQVDAVYDENARVTSLTYMDWDPFEQEWTLWDVDSFAYDVEGRIITLLYLDWDTDSEELVNWRKWEYTYDGTGNPETEKYLKWDTTEAVWDPVAFYEYSLNGDNLLLARKEYAWNAGNSSWEAITLGEILYTARGNRSQVTSSDWDDVNETWDAYEQIVYTYDGQGNMLTRETSNWDVDTEGWIGESRETFSYESQIEAEQVWLPFDIGFNGDEIFGIRFENGHYEYFYDPAVVEEMFYWNFNVFEFVEISERFNAPLQVVLQEWNDDDGEWKDWEINDFYISNDDSAVEVPEFIQETEFRIYPNPVTGLLNITLPQHEYEAGHEGMIRIYNLDGRHVMSLISGATNQVDVSHLESGVYILSVSTPNRSYYGKFMKK